MAQPTVPTRDVAFMYAGPIPAVGGPAAQGAAAPAGGGPSKHNDTLFDSILTSALGADAERARLGTRAPVTPGRRQGAGAAPMTRPATSPRLRRSWPGRGRAAARQRRRSVEPGRNGWESGRRAPVRARWTWACGSLGAAREWSKQDWRPTAPPCSGARRKGPRKALR